MNKETKELVETLAKGLTQEDIIRGEERAKGYVEGFKDGVESSKNFDNGYWICPECGLRVLIAEKMKRADDAI